MLQILNGLATLFLHHGLMFTTTANPSARGVVSDKLAWLFAPRHPASPEIRSYLLAQLMGSMGAALMGSLCSILVLGAAFWKSGENIFAALIMVDLAISMFRLIEWNYGKRRAEIAGYRNITVSASLSIAWCTLQGVSAFIILSGDDPVLQVLSATLAMALIGPLCARNYAAPRFAILMVLLCDLPFAAGAVMSSEPWLSLILVLTPPFLLGVMQIIATLHDAMLDTLFAKEENHRLATHDSLTSLLNRQGMDEQLARFSPQHDRTMALLSLDLDGFKAINDTHGHGAGDRVLVEVARRIQDVVGEDDLVARMGGDEFMIILCNREVDEFRAIAVTLVNVIASELISIGPETSVGLRVSVGYACIPEDAGTTMELRLRADRALYDAKESGKGTCRRFGEKTEYDIGSIYSNLREAYI
ncbi:GGDEF domain-containing protein [Parasphingorhabdus sp.]|uniref:GGDEF domain-containing protein n=1 Tax=Parasphingorhabdus sp. TaxID=2709688 RepID=UPI003002989F